MPFFCFSQLLSPSLTALSALIVEWSFFCTHTLNYLLYMIYLIIESIFDSVSFFWKIIFDFHSLYISIYGFRFSVRASKSEKSGNNCNIASEMASFSANKKDMHCSRSRDADWFVVIFSFWLLTNVCVQRLCLNKLWYLFSQAIKLKTFYQNKSQK